MTTKLNFRSKHVDEQRPGVEGQDISRAGGFSSFFVVLFYGGQKQRELETTNHGPRTRTNQSIEKANATDTPPATGERAMRSRSPAAGLHLVVARADHVPKLGTHLRTIAHAEANAHPPLVVLLHGEETRKVAVFPD